MFKKLLSLLIAACMLLTILPSMAMADENDEIKAAKKAIQNGKETVQLKNDMTSDEFLRAMATLLPEGSNVTLGFSKESDYRIYNATSQKDGSIFANIEFNCGVYKLHEMYDVKIPALTGKAAEDNADREKITEDSKLAKAAFNNMAFDNTVTEDEILERARAAVKNGSTIVSGGDFTKVEAQIKKRGSVKLTLKLTLNNETASVKVSNVIRELPAESSIPEETTKPSTDNTNDNTEKTDVTVKFEDVRDGAYYADAVKWAVSKNITSGTSDTTFSPDNTCTRAQILTFLWRAFGSPAPESSNPFSDVSSSDYFCNAAVWAFDNDMIDSFTFDGNTPCTRASTVIYLWQISGSPIVEQNNNFSDVPEDSDYAEAVAWAVSNNITSGTSDTTFSPDAICSRGQIVTFLNRTINK